MISRIIFKKKGINKRLKAGIIPLIIVWLAITSPISADTAIKTWNFTGSAEGLADAGNNASLTFAHDATDNAVKFTTTTKASTMTEFGRRSTTGETWETWGVPSGSTVTNVQITAWQEKLVANTKLSSHTIKARIIGSGGGTVHSAGDLLNVSLGTTIDSSYQAGTAGSQVAVDAGSQASSTDVRLELDYTVVTLGGGGSANVDQRFDAIELTITYSPPVATLTQNDWRIYVDNDALDPTDPWGNPDLSENTPLTSLPTSNDPVDPGDEVRIRMTIAVSTTTLAAASEGFILQYKETNDCTDGTSWTDIDAAGGAGIWRFASSSVTDNTALSGDPPTVGDLNIGVSDRAGRYSKSDPTSTNPFAISAGEDLEWDWHIQYNGTAGAHSYCFRMRKDDPADLNAYNSDSYPTIETRPVASPDFMRHGNFFTTGEERGFFWAD